MKKIFLTAILAVTVMLAFIINSCESNTYDDISGVENPTYSANVKAVIDANCISCHSGGSQYPDLENYEDVKDAIQEGDLICRIEGFCGLVMPPPAAGGKMPQSTIDMIKLWRDQEFVN